MRRYFEKFNNLSVVGRVEDLNQTYFSVKDTRGRGRRQLVWMASLLIFLMPALLGFAYVVATTSGITIDLLPIYLIGVTLALITIALVGLDCLEICQLNYLIVSWAVFVAIAISFIPWLVSIDSTINGYVAIGASIGARHLTGYKLSPLHFGLAYFPWVGAYTVNIYLVLGFLSSDDYTLLAFAAFWGVFEMASMSALWQTRLGMGKQEEEPSL